MARKLILFLTIALMAGVGRADFNGDIYISTEQMENMVKPSTDTVITCFGAICYDDEGKPYCSSTSCPGPKPSRKFDLYPVNLPTTFEPMVVDSLYRGPVTTEWIEFHVSSSTWTLQLGLRSDGVVMWRKIQDPDASYRDQKSHKYRPKDKR